MLDPDGHVTNWNTGAAAHQGLSPEEIVGQHFSRFYTEEDRAAGVPQRSAARPPRREGRFEKEGWRVRKDGTRFWANVVIDAIRDDAGELDRLRQDHPRHHRAARRAAGARAGARGAVPVAEDGGHRPADRRRRARLQQSADGGAGQPRTAAQARCPTIRGCTPLLDNAMQGAERGAALTQRMLAFARRQDLEPEPVDVPALVARHDGPAAAHRSGPSIAIETRFPAEPARRSRPTPTSSNSRCSTWRSTPATPCRTAAPITIAARERDRDRRPATADAGPLRAPRGDRHGRGHGRRRRWPRATEPFFTTKGVGKGTGLGLSMVQGLAEQSGGRLVLKSRKGEGTTVEIWLPVAESPLRQAPVAQRRRRSEQRTAQPLVRPRRRRRRAGADEHRRHAGGPGPYGLDGEFGRRGARDPAGGTHVDLVITDHAMPHMTGPQLSQ